MPTELHSSGFTIVRNAEILGFPFKESVLSVLPLCDEFIINCGDSEDHTLSICEQLRNQFPNQIKIIKSVWQKENQTGGYQLKEQTNRAMAECQGKWLFYIQADEVFHEDDYPKIREAVQIANAMDEVDGLVFDYLHFYADYSHIAQGRNWYRREVRAFKNGRGIQSFRDAQGFRIEKNRLKALCSDARVFHYGYVRSIPSLKKKVQEMSQWWGESPPKEEDSVQIYRPVGLRPFKDAHPKVMRETISNNNNLVDPGACKRVWNAKEIKNAVTLIWEKIIPIRLGEYRNYDLVKPKRT
jgi:glycosyltransferase involved in cell wall biosynthesis